MSRPAIITLALVEGVENYSALLTEASKDGVIDPEEQQRLIRAYRPIVRKVERLHAGVQFVGRALTGKGIDSPWFDRQWREDRKDRLYLVQSRNDDPDPDGPGGQKRAA